MTHDEKMVALEFLTDLGWGSTDGCLPSREEVKELVNDFQWELPNRKKLKEDLIRELVEDGMDKMLDFLQLYLQKEVAHGFYWGALETFEWFTEEELHDFALDRTANPPKITYSYGVQDEEFLKGENR